MTQINTQVVDKTFRDIVCRSETLQRMFGTNGILVNTFFLDSLTEVTKPDKAMHKVCLENQIESMDRIFIETTQPHYHEKVYKIPSVNTFLENSLIHKMFKPTNA